MRNLSLFFVKALQTVMDGQPIGSKAQLAEAANVSRSQITDILKGRRYGGSEEVRRSIVAALGWNYEDFLKYGESLVNGTDFTLPVNVRTIYKPERYASVPQFARLVKMTIPDGYRWCPVFSEEDPCVFLKSCLGKHADNEHLAVCQMPDESMAPAIAKNTLMLVDVSVKNAEHDKVFIFNEGEGADRYLVRRVKLREGTDEIYLLSDKGSLPILLQETFAERAVAKVLWSFNPHD